MTRVRLETKPAVPMAELGRVPAPPAQAEAEPAEKLQSLVLVEPLTLVTAASLVPAGIARVPVKRGQRGELAA
jgi:hypothetical protein